MIFLKLFIAFFQIGLFSIGGGYAAMPLIQNQVVEINSWLTMNEFADIVTIAEMTPGPIAINAATFVGTRMAGFPGALIATLGCLTPSCVIVSILAVLYKKYSNLSRIQGVLKGLRPAVVGLIATAGVSILNLSFWNGNTISIRTTNFVSVILFAASLFVLRKFKLNPILVMGSCGILGMIIYHFV